MKPRTITLDWLAIKPPRGYRVASPPYVRLHGQGASVLIERIEPTPAGLTPMAYKPLSEASKRRLASWIKRIAPTRKTAPGGTRQSSKKGAAHKEKRKITVREAPGARKGVGKAGRK